MKCRFCGKRIKKDSTVCSKCGADVTEGLNQDELIDTLPELHDEFDNISKIQAKEKRKKEKKEKNARHRTRRIVISVLVVLVILAGVLGGMLYVKHKEQEEEKLKEAQIVESSAVDSTVVKTFMASGFTDKIVTDSALAKEVILEQKNTFTDASAEFDFKLEKEIKIGTSTLYRFNQQFRGIPVYGGEMVLLADKNGKVTALNGTYIPTENLSVSYLLDKGSASAAITEYVNSLDDFAIVAGINITEIQKAVCNNENKAYIAYKANVSGYNNDSEYIAYDVFVDAKNGEGICVSVTSSYENESAVTKEDVRTSYIFDMASANDKFNWNDDSIEIAREYIDIKDVQSGNVSAYVSGVKNAVDSAYNYFNNAFSYKGLSGDGKNFLVYINSNEYVEEDLPTEKAMYTDAKLMFFREDLTQGDIDYNTVVHEYAHGVMHNIAGFRGTMDFSENSIIAEGLADIFAELAEATINGTSPDWVHGERILSEAPYVVVEKELLVGNVQECYEYSKIVSHLAYKIFQSVPDISVQNELWFKTMCLMTKSTDFSEFESIINAVVSNMYEEYKISDAQYAEVVEIIKNFIIA